MEKAVTVEFFHAGGCIYCVTAREALRDAALQSSQVEWIEIDIGKDPQRAVDMGVLTTPAIAIDGTLMRESAPTARQLQSAICARIAKR